MSQSMFDLLAERIARDIFACGDGPNSPTIRIEFKGGEPDKEKPQGGFCEKGLVEFIAKSIEENLRLGLIALDKKK